MTREELLKDYEVDRHGIIRSPGKFEGEYITAPYFFNCMMEGDGELQEDNSTILCVLKEDRDEFPEELHGVKRVRISVDEQGFVYAEHITA